MRLPFSPSPGPTKPRRRCRRSGRPLQRLEHQRLGGQALRHRQRLPCLTSSASSRFPEALRDRGGIGDDLRSFERADEAGLRDPPPCARASAAPGTAAKPVIRQETATRDHDASSRARAPCPPLWHGAWSVSRGDSRVRPREGLGICRGRTSWYTRCEGSPGPSSAVCTAISTTDQRVPEEHAGPVDLAELTSMIAKPGEHPGGTAAGAGRADGGLPRDAWADVSGQTEDASDRAH